MANEQLGQKPTITALDATTLVAVTQEIGGIRRVRQAPTDLFKGLDGVSAIATITNPTPAPIPAAGLTVQYAVNQSGGFDLNQIVTVGGVGTLKVVGLPTPAAIALENIDAPPGAVVTGAKIAPATRGAEVHFVTAAPANTLGADKDTAFRSTGQIYKKVAGAWVEQFNYATDAELTAAIAAFQALVDAFPQYLTQAEGDARYALQSALNESIDDRVSALLVAGTNITLTYNDTTGALTISATASSSGGASGIPYTYNDADPPTAAGQIRTPQASLAVATIVAINPVDANGDDAVDITARLKTGAIFTIAKDAANYVRLEATADYTSGSVAVVVRAEQGAITTGDTVYLAIASDAPSASSGGGLTIVEETGATATVASNTLVKSNRATAQVLSVTGASGIIAVQGVGAGIWSLRDGTFITPVGTSDSGLRRLATHRYASVELINIGGSNWVIRHPADLTGIELFAVGSGDTRVVDYFAAITAAGGTFTGGDQSAFANALTALDLIVPWADVVCWYPMIGGTLPAMAIDAKDPANTTQRITWGAGSTASSAGVLLGGTTTLPVSVFPTGTAYQLSTVASIKNMNVPVSGAGVFFASANNEYSFSLTNEDGFEGRGLSVAGGGTFWPIGLAGLVRPYQPFSGSVVHSTQPGQQQRAVSSLGNAITTTARSRSSLSTSSGIRLGGASGVPGIAAFTYTGFLVVTSATGLTLAQDQGLQVLAANLQTALLR